MEDAMVEVLTDETFKSQVENGKGVALVDFYADWCMPCKMMAPIIEELAKEYDGKVFVGKLNVDNAHDTAVEYRVMSIPTMIIFKDGEKKEEFIGARDGSELKAAIAKYI